jgi:type IV secretory pathway ATPase VirB11/archaellum biosynthesis ATPase
LKTFLLESFFLNFFLNFHENVERSLAFGELLLICFNIGMGSALGVGFPPNHQPQTNTQTPQQEEGGPKTTTATAAATGSDLLDVKTHDLKLEKSNIMMFGSTGSGKTSLISRNIFLLLNVDVSKIIVLDYR